MTICNFLILFSLPILHPGLGEGDKTRTHLKLRLSVLLGLPVVIEFNFSVFG